MRCHSRPLRLTLRSLLALFISGTAFFGSAAFAQDSSPDHTQFGSNITIGPNEQAGDVTCFGCTVRIHGHVMGDATVFGGSIILEGEGQVDGDVTDFGTGVRLGKEAKIGGDVTVFGGAVRRDTSSSVGGEVTTFTGSFWLVLIFGLPVALLGAILALAVWIVRRLTQPAIPVTV
jgi:hypothetical protein